jgi:hypothetical protein
MFYHNTRYTFPLAAGSPDTIAGGIIAASAMSRPQLVRRKLSRASYLQHCLLDPQLYLADLASATAGKNVVNLGTYPWFRCEHQSFESGKPGGLPQWKAEQANTLVQGWPGAAATDPKEVADCAQSAIEIPLALGCEAVILPSPMTRAPGGGYATEARWLDAGLAACSKLRVSMPVYATIAIADSALRELNPLENPLLQTLTAHVASRDGLAGAYVVIAQNSEDEGSWICKDPDTLLSLLVIVDDIVRGAGRDVIVNGVGTFGLVAAAVGARIWSSGYYRSQRRMRTSDYNDSEGRTVPRYFSARLLGDVGVEHDLALVARDAVGRRVLTDTPSAAALNAILRGGGTPADVPEWEYTPGTPTAAMAHHNHCMQGLSTALGAASVEQRVNLMDSMLRRAETVAQSVREIVTARPRPDGQVTKHTDFLSQRIWREVFEKWRLATGR